MSAVIPTTKVCSGCKTERLACDFVRDKNRPDGLYSRCKFCRRTYYLENRQRVLDQHNAYRRRPGIREALQRWKKEYNTRHFFYKTARNLRLRHVGEATASPVNLARLWKRQRGKCAVTGRKLSGNSAQLDHITSLKAGGLGITENLRWVHRDVNYAKRDLSDHDFAKLIGEIYEWSLTVLGKEE